MFVCFSVQPLPAAQGGLLVGDRRVDLPSFVVVHPRVEPPSAKCSYYHLRLFFFSYPFIYLFPIYLSTYISIYLSIWRLSCKPPRNYAQWQQKLQLQNRISPRRQTIDFEALFKRSLKRKITSAEN